jgi:AbrB family looped-hinge helix DNA binding protein
VRITSKGQVTIPQAIRERAGLLPDTDVTFDYDGSAVRVFPTPKAASPSRGARLVAQMRGRAKDGLSTEELMALTRGE